ncbi:restriction endonuclease subunit S [Paenibacillus sp. FSL R7-0312]|uniref:restriction endonuclease subunit S n=1 Tax=Paenibacillus sp. FSL R7-0312 TaxID=2921682 RepID=UPI0030F534CE
MSSDKRSNKLLIHLDEKKIACLKWEEMSISDVCDSIVDCVNKTAPTVDYATQYKMIRTTNVKNGNIDLESVKYVSEDVYKVWTRRSTPQIGDVILTREAPIGEVGIVKTEDKIFLGQRLIQFRANPKMLNSRFLLYSMKSPFMQRQIQLYEGTGSTVSHIRVPDCLKFKIRVPDSSIQNKIANILGSIDDKIELNNRMNKVLEQMAQAIFKQWFVDFEFPNENGETYKSSGSVMEWCEELGKEIPKGWTIKYLKELVAINERSITKSYSFESIKYVDISSVDNGKLQRLESIPLESAPSRAKRLTRHGDVLWSTVRPNRKSYLYIHNPDPNMVVSTGFVVLTSKLIPSSFLYCSVTTDEFVQHLTNNAEGSAYPAVRPETFGRFEMLVPSTDVLERFDDIVSVIRKRIANNEQESNVLSELRDTLLPKLMSGEIDVSQVEL